MQRLTEEWGCSDARDMLPEEKIGQIRLPIGRKFLLRQVTVLNLGQWFRQRVNTGTGYRDVIGFSHVYTGFVVNVYSRSDR